MEQLPLEVRLADYALFDTFCTGPNAAAVHALADLARTDGLSLLWLWGQPQSGKTHLLQACVNALPGIAPFDTLQSSRVLQILIDAEIHIQRRALEHDAHRSQCFQRIRA